VETCVSPEAGVVDSRATPRAIRPHLLPAAHWARIALAILCVFTFARGALWATTTPSFWGPDEDYHFLYVDHVAKYGTIIDPDQPLFTDEYIETTNRTQFNAYGNGPRLDFSGDPKRELGVLAALPKTAREGKHQGRDPAVVHPPLYYYLGATADRASEAFGGTAAPTRMLWVRLVSALISVVGVYASWLLASLFFGRASRLALLAALLVATQPILAFLSGFVSNDIAVFAAFTGVSAYLMFLLQTPAYRRQGLVLGVLLSVALLTKATTLVLLPAAALALLLQRFTFRTPWRETFVLAGYAAAPLLVGAAWWYVHTKVAYGTFTGEVLADGVASSTAGKQSLPSPGIDGYLTLARGWLADAYKTGWFHTVTYEAPQGRWLYFAPGALIGVGLIGVAGFAASVWRRALDPADARLRQLVVLAASFVLLLLPFLVLDVQRAAGGLGYLVAAGRFIAPAYPALVVLVLAGLVWLLSDVARRPALTLLGLGSAAFCWYDWKTHYVQRYFGESDLGNAFEKMAFDRPGWVVPTTYWLLLLVVLASAAAFAYVTLAQGRRPTPPRLPRRRAS